jgi:hypothetical protein
MGEAGGVGEEANEEASGDKASGDKASEVALGQGGGGSEVGPSVQLLQQLGAEFDLDMSDLTWDETDGSLF